MRTMALLLLPLPLLGCSGSDDCADANCAATGDDDDVTGDDDDDVVYTGCLADGIDLDPGTGIEAFEALLDGDDMVMVHGPQGGWHIDVAGRVSNTEQLIGIQVSFTDSATGNLVGGDQQETRTALVGWDETSCSGDFYGTRIFVDDLSDNVIQDDICGLDGAELDMVMTVTALEAKPPASVTVTLPVRAVLDPADVPICAKK